MFLSFSKKNPIVGLQLSYSFGHPARAIDAFDHYANCYSCQGDFVVTLQNAIKSLYENKDAINAMLANTPCILVVNVKVEIVGFIDYKTKRPAIEHLVFDAADTKLRMAGE